ncbi:MULTISPECIES: preprotein translocase subunit SecY [unclassified Pyramidobacter]|uniref:preprotein translocase subunit SecY n=1 Tax=unclassified Pyramidobacter TaxID=2632171 RepID=UPI0009900A03|nr:MULTISPECIES: preprotein translocase subunit SecY [unclassified Pyramidobacter]MCI7403116.1 preprotein translocase subunit SecY [Pyramidobacter sp.]MDY3212669.1 preprotein translocase subunit SecY [Pyramidobacter sp.]OON89138.1 preprotein translocase subunit SecY [Pyramidobacter sp. C12-8]RKJ78623.1 preprotein translocase subunit SecY [Pyramidobacter sp. CG50-2]WOL40835.1 preprotein translocase subunit SecY [Pyramidobacter sp. YE332]
MADTFRDVFKLPDLKRRILFTLGMLFVFRLGAHIPTPGINSAAMSQLFEGSGVLGFLDLFAGGALRRFSLFSLGVAPYINASIVLQLAAVIFPTLERLQKEGPQGQKKMTQYTRYGAIFFAFVQAVGMAMWLRRAGVLAASGLDFFVAVITAVTGSVAVMWLGEEMTDHGIGNGISLLIFAGIVARLPEAVIQTLSMVSSGEMNVVTLILALAVMVAVLAGAVLLEQGQRRLPVQYAKRVVGNRVYGGQSSFIPLRVNMGGVMPIIFASSLLIFPSTVLRLFHGTERLANYFAPGSWLYTVLYVVLIVFFSFFYTAMVFNPSDIADNMKKNGGFILGIRPGKPTSDYIEKIASRITLVGSVFLVVVALVPDLLTNVFGITSFYFGGTSVLIIVGVALEIVEQVNSQLLMRNYEGVLKRAKSGRGLLRF